MNYIYKTIVAWLYLILIKSFMADSENGQKTCENAYQKTCENA